MQAKAKSKVPQELGFLRNTIDSIDEEILTVLARRFEVTNKVGQLKATHGLDSVDPVREQEKLQRLQLSADLKGLNGQFVQELFQQVFIEVVKNHRSFHAKAISKS